MVPHRLRIDEEVSAVEGIFCHPAPEEHLECEEVGESREAVVVLERPVLRFGCLPEPISGRPALGLVRARRKEHNRRGASRCP